MKLEDLDFLEETTRTLAGFGLRGDRTYLAETHLGPLARREGAASVGVLIERLRNDREPKLVQAVVEALAASDTAFFRDRGVFKRLSDEILPGLAARRLNGVVRVWCAGCGTGQEVYSLGLMAAAEPSLMAGVELQLFASDLSERALQKARAGVYSHFEVQRGLPIRLLLEHFDRADDMWRISARIRQNVRWARINLMDDFSRMGPFDVILCRNVLSQFDAVGAARVLESLDGVIARDGWLVLGQNESLQPPAAYEAEGDSGLFQRNPAFGREAA